MKNTGKRPNAAPCAAARPASRAGMPYDEDRDEEAAAGARDAALNRLHPEDREADEDDGEGDSRHTAAERSSFPPTGA